MPGSIAFAFRSRAAQDPHASDRRSVVLTLRLCLSSGFGDPLAQAARSSSRYRPPGRARPSAAAAVAAAGQRVRLPGRGGLCPEAGKGAVRLLRVRTGGAARPRSRRPDADRRPRRGRTRRCRAAAGERRRGKRARRVGSRVGAPRSRLPAGWHPQAVATTGRAWEQSDAYRRELELRKGWALPGFTLWTVVSRPPGQASPMVARRKPDLPVPPRWRASPPHPLVGGDRHPSPVSPDRGSRRRHHDRVVGVRRPRAERRRRGGHPVDRPDPRFDCSTRWAAAHIPLAGAVRERAGRRPWLGDHDADFLRHGTTLPAARIRSFAGNRDVEGPRPRNTRDLPRAGRPRRDPHGMRGSRDQAHRRRPLARRVRDPLLRCRRPPDPRLRRALGVTEVPCGERDSVCDRNR